MGGVHVHITEYAEVRGQPVGVGSPTKRIPGFNLGHQCWHLVPHISSY